ncbi:MAG TPA: protease pro-enzyme activation domain-containing protein [Streptosporangiaceae bacterium]|nr:protease pro-enzyme activation domain-containing protein [Streptosporangiaceae bacterium]
MKPATCSARLRVGALLAAGAAGSLLLLSAVVPAGATTSPSTGKVAVPQALSVAGLVGHSVFPKPINGSTKETVSFVLKLRQASTLESDVEKGMPGGFLKVGTFASRYGQTKARVAALEKYLRSFGLKPTAYADRLDVSVTGTARRFNKALSVTESDYTTKAIPARGNQPARPAVTFHGTTDQPLLPKSLAGFVYAILGLTDYPVASSNALHTPTPEERTTRAGYQLGNRTPANFAKQYGLSSLYSAGATGNHQTIGIITYASIKPSNATYFWSKILKIKTKANRIKLDNIDGGSGAVSYDAGSSETTLDVEQSGAIARLANIVVYQAPNTDYGSADAWFGAASQNVAQTISTSWGESEIMNEAIAADKTEAATYGGIFDEAGLEMAAQGQSAFDASGDSGAYDDAEDYPTAYTELSVDNPADSPWITAGGGTTNPGKIELYDQYGDPADTVTISAQRAWGWDYLFPYYALFGNPNPSSSTSFTSEPPFVADPYYAGGGGGGYSVVEKQPAYQSKIKGIDDYSYVPYVSYPDCQTDASACAVFNATTTTQTPCASTTPSELCLPTTWTAWDAGTGSATPPAVQTGTFSGAGGRAVPDIVADADPYTGYEEYFSQWPGGGGTEDGWGGTSFVAPQLNGSAAVIDSYLHHRTGFWNPAIYRFAAVPSWTPFTPLDSASANNDNLYYTGTAKAIYNPGSGLGVPNLDKLALDFKRHGLAG